MKRFVADMNPTVRGLILIAIVSAAIVALRAESALQRRSVQRRYALRERATTEQVSCINRPISRARPSRQAVIHHHTSALKRRQARLAFAVGQEVNQVQLLQRRLRRRVHRDRRQLGCCVAQLRARVHKGRAVQLGRAGCCRHRLRVNGEQIARH